MCNLVKFILTLLIVSVIAIPVSIAFGSSVALIAALLGIIYILEKME